MDWAPARTAVAVLAIISLLVLSTSAVAQRTVYVRDSTQRYKVRPGNLKYIFGAGAYFYFRHLQPWHRWGHGRTTAYGSFYYNDCKPSCAEGNYRKTHAHVRLSHKRICHGRAVYRRLWFNPKRNFPKMNVRITCGGYGVPV